jgi:hypothetical protein
MKTIIPIFLICLISFSGVTSCDKNETEKTGNITVEEYIRLLKSNSYDSLNLPAFSYTDIPALLEYRNEAQIITNFPHNPISSLFRPECSLRMYVLWTIESIRAVSTDSKYLIMRFPSQNPVLALRNITEFQLISDSESCKVAAQAYFEWWENNKQKDFNEFKFIDPLANTDYRWH